MLSPHQLQEWAAFYALRPFGQFPADRRTAMLAALIANINRKRTARPFTVKDFMPPDPAAILQRGKPGHQSPEDMKAILMGMVKRTGGMERKRE